MGQNISAIMEHNLSPEQIIALPQLLHSKLEGDLAGAWGWTFGPDMNTDQLQKTWRQDMDFFLNNTWSEADLPMLERDTYSLYFGEPHLVHFDSLMRWSSYADDMKRRDMFNQWVKQLADIIGATDILLVPAPFDADVSEDDEWRVADYRKAFQDMGLKHFELER